MTNIPEALEIFQKSKNLSLIQSVISEVIIGNYWQGVDRNVVIQALAAQKELGFGGVNSTRREEARKAGLFEVKDEWTEEKLNPEGWYFLGSDILHDLNDDGEIIVAQEPSDKAREMEQAFAEAEIPGCKVRYISTDGWNDGTFTFPPETTEDPGVYRVWVHIANEPTRDMIEKLIKTTSKSYTGK